MQQTLLNLLARLPLPVLHGVSASLAWLAFNLFRWRRRLVLNNLRRAFPDQSEQARVAIARRHFQALFDTAAETLKAGSISAEQLQAHVAMPNINVLDELVDTPFLLVGGHQGNWEWQMLALSTQLQIPLEAVYAPLPSAALDEFMAAARSRFGITLIEQAQTLPEIAKRLKQPRALIMLADQNPRRDAERCWLTFLQQDTAFGLGLEKIARLTRYPVVFFNGARVARGRYELRFEVIARPPYDKEGHGVTVAYASALQRSIEAHPEDWLWNYERWRYPKPLYDS